MNFVDEESKGLVNDMFVKVKIDFEGKCEEYHVNKAFVLFQVNNEYLTICDILIKI